MEAYSWYADLVKPVWAPPASVFGPVWTILYAVIAISFGYVFYLWLKGRVRPATAVPFLLNLAFNFAFTPIEFGLRNLALASVDIVFVLATLAWALFAIRKQARWVAVANIPYLMWVCFATYLQFTVWSLNR